MSYRQILRLPEVMARTGMSRSWVYSKIMHGQFVKPIKLGRATGFDAAAVDAWIAERLSGNAESND